MAIHCHHVANSFRSGSLNSMPRAPVFSTADLEDMYAILLPRFVWPITPPQALQQQTKQWAPRVSLTMLTKVSPSKRSFDRTLITAIIQMRPILQPAGTVTPGREVLLNHLPGFQQRQYSTPAGGGSYWWPVTRWPQWTSP